MRISKTFLRSLCKPDRFYGHAIPRPEALPAKPTGHFLNAAAQFEEMGVSLD